MKVERDDKKVVGTFRKAEAKISPVKSRKKPSGSFGMDEGLVVMAVDFDETPDDFKDYA